MSSCIAIMRCHYSYLAPACGYNALRYEGSCSFFQSAIRLSCQRTPLVQMKCTLHTTHICILPLTHCSLLFQLQIPEINLRILPAQRQVA